MDQHKHLAADQVISRFQLTKLRWIAIKPFENSLVYAILVRSISPYYEGSDPVLSINLKKLSKRDSRSVIGRVPVIQLNSYCNYQSYVCYFWVQHEAQGITAANYSLCPV